MNQPDWESVKQYVIGRLEKELSPDLTYHSIYHTRDDVLPAAERLAAMTGINDEELLLLRTASLYHDIGFVEQYLQNEVIGVRIATETLPDFGFSPGQIQIIGDLIMATQLPQTPHNLLEELMCDADMDSLGREDYWPIGANLRKERAAYGTPLTLREWYTIQFKFLTGHSYFTAAARALRQAGKLKNIEGLRKRLEELESTVT